MGRGQPGRKVRSPRAAASLPARQHRQQAGGLRNSPAFSPALPFFSGGGGGGDQPGQRGSQRRLLRAGPWLLSFGRRRQRRRQRSDPCGHHRPRQHALAGRAPQQPAAAMAPVLAPPAPGTLQRPRPGFCALRLRWAQPTRRAPPPPKSAPRTRALPLTIARVWWLAAPPRVQRWETFVPPPPPRRPHS